MNTYPEMNEKIVSILRMTRADNLAAYAAQRIEELEAELNAWRARDKESEAFLVHQQHRAEADNRELQSALSLRDAQYHAAEARAKAMDFILVEMRGRGWSDKQVNDVVNDYARRIDYALKGEST